MSVAPKVFSPGWDIPPKPWISPFPEQRQSRKTRRALHNVLRRKFETPQHAMSAAGIIFEALVRDLLSQLCTVSASCALSWEAPAEDSRVVRKSEIDSVLLSWDTSPGPSESVPLMLFEVGVTTVPLRALRRKRKQLFKNVRVAQEIIPGIRGCIILVTVPGQDAHPDGYPMVEAGSFLQPEKFRDILTSEPVPIFVLDFWSIWEFGKQRGYPLPRALSEGVFSYAREKRGDDYHLSAG